ncbi:MAG: efflux RND transporter periplasmic adaptor subunit [Opitutaceae bacterium]|nr:efflux RND transporter periplasmic adaptor subunit [Opitutaceae bacterium]
MPCPLPFPNTRRATLPPLALLGLSALLFAGCSDKAARQTKPAPLPVQVAVAEIRTVPRTLELIGSVQPLRTVAVKSQIDGVVAAIHFREGDEVRPGDLLITLDRRPFENALNIARADLAIAQAEAARAAADADRYTSLDQQAAVSKEQFAQLLTRAATTRTQVLAREAAVANAELQLGYTGIRAPIGVRTGELRFHEGALVKANDAGNSLVTINQLAPIAVAFAVPESSLDAVRAAAAAEVANVSVRNRGGNALTLTGALAFIDNAVDPATGTILLKAELPNADHALWPGRFVDVTLQLGADSGLVVVPAAAVQQGQQGPQVFVVQADRTVALRPVVVARTTGEIAVLARGVQPGDTVVLEGQFRLMPGARVEPRPTAPSAPAAP